MNKKRYFLLFHFLLGAVFFHPIRELAEFSWNHNYCSHILLVPFVTAWLLFQKRREFGAAEVTGSRWGWVVMMLGFVLYPCAIGWRGQLNHNDYLTVAALGIVVAWAGGFLSFFGWSAFRASLFPIGFLIFMVPIPSAALESLVYGLQVGSTWAAERWFDVIGLPVDRKEFVFELPRTTIEVAKQCSGIRSCIALCLTGLLFAHLFCDSGWFNAAAAILAFPVSIVKNGFRIMVIGSSMNQYGDNWIIFLLHRKGGIVFFVPAVATLILLLVAAKKFTSWLNVERTADTRHTDDEKAVEESL